MKKFLAVLAVVAVSLPAFSDNGIITRWYENDSVWGTALLTNSAAGKARLVIDEVGVSTMSLSASSTISLTSTSVAVAVTGSVVPISGVTALTNATLSAVAASKVGQIVRVINVGTNDITILDAAPAYLSGNLVLGQRDALNLYIYATNQLIQTGTSNN